LLLSLDGTKLTMSSVSSKTNDRDMDSLQKSFAVIEQHVTVPPGTEAQVIDLCASIASINFSLGLASRGVDSRNLDQFQTGAAIFVLHGVSKHLSERFGCEYEDLLMRACKVIDIEQMQLRAAAAKALQSLRAEKDTPQVKKIEQLCADAVAMVLKNDLIPGRSHLSGLWNQLAAMLRQNSQPVH
jgi:hypothetical protein